MIEHIYLPGLNLSQDLFHPYYEEYLREWRDHAFQKADNGEAAASICYQATLIDLVLEGKPDFDWLSVMDDLLLDHEKPLSYSEKYGERLNKFTAQYKQSTIYAIHTRWWLENLIQPNKVDHNAFAALILNKKQSDGLFYDRDVSETTLRHRMKTELTMSAAQSVEILKEAQLLSQESMIELATEIVSPVKCPALGYMSMEYFRFRTLELLNLTNLFPVGISDKMISCSVGLRFGWGDFSMRSKVDAYMGTANRTQRDKPIHSPLIACYVKELSKVVGETEKKDAILARLKEYQLYLTENPTDIPAFQMRDIPINFGSDKTPIEVICASYLILTI